MADYFWLNIEQKDIQKKIEETFDYHLYAQEGIGRLRQSFDKLSSSSHILGYVISPHKQVRCLLEFVTNRDRKAIFRIKKFAEKVIDFHLLESIPELKDRKLITYQTKGRCLWEISQEEFDIIYKRMFPSKQDPEDIFLAEIETLEHLSEGGKKYIQTIKYERNTKNRDAAIKIHGNKCKACRFDFNEFYGKAIANDYIEVHHIKPLSTLKEEAKVNPETDLIPLCSNCHRMIHKENISSISFEEICDRYKK